MTKPKANNKAGNDRHIKAASKQDEVENTVKEMENDFEEGGVDSPDKIVNTNQKLVNLDKQSRNGRYSCDG